MACARFARPRLRTDHTDHTDHTDTCQGGAGLRARHTQTVYNLRDEGERDDHGNEERQRPVKEGTKTRKKEKRKGGGGRTVTAAHQPNRTAPQREATHANASPAAGRLPSIAARRAKVMVMATVGMARDTGKMMAVKYALRRSCLDSSPRMALMVSVKLDSQPLQRGKRVRVAAPAMCPTQQRRRVTYYDLTTRMP